MMPRHGIVQDKISKKWRADRIDPSGASFLGLFDSEASAQAAFAASGPATVPVSTPAGIKTSPAVPIEQKK